MLSTPDSSSAEKYVMVPKDEESVGAWMECFRRNAVYSEVVVLQEEVAAAHAAFRKAKKEAQQAKEKLQEARGTAIARSIASKQRLAKDLARVPEPEKQVLDGPSVTRQITIKGADGLLQADSVGASDPCVTHLSVIVCTPGKASCKRIAAQVRFGLVERRRDRTYRNHSGHVGSTVRYQQSSQRIIITHYL